MKKFLLVSTVIFCSIIANSQEIKPLNLNRTEREEWFTELGFGMFIHWSFDVQLGMVISHSMVGASDDYLQRYIYELPKTFNPEDFNAEKWAKAAKLAGMKYVVFTTKHHNGFCMYDTKTTEFNIMNTPYSKDVTAAIVKAFRKEDLAIGFYFSPDDFHFLYHQDVLISRRRPEALPSNNPELLTFIKKQMEELMTQYGEIDILFLDGQDQYSKTELAKVAWSINPDVLVTRGAIETPEQTTPDSPLPSPWESCYTLGDQWQYRPTNENYKNANNVIQKLIEIRAKGGNLLMNFGPDADGNFPPEQYGVLNEIALWMFINQEAFKRVVPHNPVREENLWFLNSENGKTVYVFIVEDDWKFGERKSYQIKSIQASANAKISVLGHDGKVLEYAPDVDPKPELKILDDGIEISVMRAQRIYNDRQWKNPIVVKIELFD